jgi:hypothetical protein
MGKEASSFEAASYAGNTGPRTGPTLGIPWSAVAA